MTFPEDARHLSWQAQHFRTYPSPFCVAGAALQTCRLACFFFANRIGRAAGIGDKLQIAWQA